MAVAEKAEDRLVVGRLDTDDGGQRQQLLAHRQGNETGIEMGKGHPPFLCQRPQLIFVIVEQAPEILRLDDEPLMHCRREDRRAQLRQPRDGAFRRGRNLGTPLRVEVPDAKQLDAGLHQLLLRREKRRQLDVARVQLDFDDRLADNLKLYKTEIFDGEGYRVIIRRMIAEPRQEFLAVREHPLTVGGDQHGQPFHPSLLAARLAPLRPSNRRSEKVNN